MKEPLLFFRVAGGSSAVNYPIPNRHVIARSKNYKY